MFIFFEIETIQMENAKTSTLSALKFCILSGSNRFSGIAQKYEPEIEHTVLACQTKQKTQLTHCNTSQTMNNKLHNGFPEALRKQKATTSAGKLNCHKRTKEAACQPVVSPLKRNLL